MFNDQCKVIEVEPYDISFGYTRTLTEEGPTELKIEKIKDMTPNEYQPITLTATLTLGKGELDKVSTQHGTQYIKNNCVLEDNTGLISCKLWYSTYTQVRNEKTYCLTNMLLKAFRSEIYLVSTRETQVTEVVSEILHSSGSSYLASQTPTLFIDEFLTVKDMQKFFICSSCSKPIEICEKTKKVAVACTICKAMCKVSKLAVHFSGKVEFCQDGENT